MTLKHFTGALWVVLALFSTAAAAQPKAELWPRWTAHDAASTRVIDHSRWDRWLARNIVTGKDGVNRIPYRSVVPADRKALEGYIAELGAVPVGGLNRGEQMAYWINLYNALTVKVVLDHYPVESILRIGISPGWFSFGPWGRKLVRIEGEEVSLDDIEHRILRPIWRDARIHYVVNCAAVGCPNLARRAYGGARIDAMLDAAARAYINNWHGAGFEDGELYVSSLYSWYVEDFGGDVPGVLAHLGRYAAPGLKRRLESVEDIAGYRYDWDLNEAAGKFLP